MALADFEDSRNRGQPVELYLFSYGPDADARIAICDCEFPVTYAGVTYTPSPIQRPKISSAQSLDKSELVLKTTMSSPVAELFRISTPSYPVDVTIRAGHYADPDNEFVVIFVGRVQQTKRAVGKAREVEISCVPDSISIRRSGLRRHYQLTCPHVLYDSEDFSCQASKAAATVTGKAITALDYLSLTFSSGWNGAFAAQKFVGGMVEWTGDTGPEKRTILRVTSNTLKLNAPTTGLVVADLVDIVLGCNHQTTDCETLHNNIKNFGGMPYIPSTNPVKTNPFS